MKRVAEPARRPAPLAEPAPPPPPAHTDVKPAPGARRMPQPAATTGDPWTHLHPARVWPD